MADCGWWVFIFRCKYPWGRKWKETAQIPFAFQGENLRSTRKLRSNPHRQTTSPFYNMLIYSYYCFSHYLCYLLLSLWLNCDYIHYILTYVRFLSRLAISLHPASFFFSLYLTGFTASFYLLAKPHVYPLLLCHC